MPGSTPKRPGATQRPHLRSRSVSTRQTGHGGNSVKNLRRNTGNRPYNASHPKRRCAEKAYTRSAPPLTEKSRDSGKCRLHREEPGFPESAAPGKDAGFRKKKDAGCLTALASQPKPNYLLPCIGAAGCAVPSAIAGRPYLRSRRSSDWVMSREIEIEINWMAPMMRSA